MVHRIENLSKSLGSLTLLVEWAVCIKRHIATKKICGAREHSLHWLIWNIQLLIKTHRWFNENVKSPWNGAFYSYPKRFQTVRKDVKLAWNLNFSGQRYSTKRAINLESHLLEQKQLFSNKKKLTVCLMDFGFRGDVTGIASRSSDCLPAAWKKYRNTSLSWL